MRRGAFRKSSTHSLMLIALAGEDPMNDACSVSGVHNEAVEVEGDVKMPSDIRRAKLGTSQSAEPVIFQPIKGLNEIEEEVKESADKLSAS